MERINLLHGTLGMMILRTLDTLGPMHGYGIARRIEQISKDIIEMNQGTLYPALLQLHQAGYVSAKWGRSETNRRVKFYQITPKGRKQFTAEAESWRKIAEIVDRFADPQTAL